MSSHPIRTAAHLDHFALRCGGDELASNSSNAQSAVNPPTRDGLIAQTSRAIDGMRWNVCAGMVCAESGFQYIHLGPCQRDACIVVVQLGLVGSFAKF